MSRFEVRGIRAIRGPPPHGDVEHMSLEKRSQLNPMKQREEFVKENLNSPHQVDAFDMRGTKDLVVVSYNTYYSRVRDADTEDMEEHINIDKTLEMIDALINRGADIILLQEVVFSESTLSDKPGESYGSDDYSEYNIPGFTKGGVPFFSAAAFESSGNKMTEFVTKKGWILEKGIASNASMYRKKFGNAVIFNPKSLERKHIVHTGTQVEHTLLPGIPGDMEARSAIFMDFENNDAPNMSFTVVCTHLTEKQVEEVKGDPINGLRQTQMTEALLKHVRNKTHVILGGDMNVNQIDKLSPDDREFCENNKFLRVKTNPYKVLKNAGFIDSDKFNPTAWNGVAVDYMGSRGIQMTQSGVLANILRGPNGELHSVSDHMFPWGCFDTKSMT